MCRQLSTLMTSFCLSPALVLSAMEEPQEQVDPCIIPANDTCCIEPLHTQRIEVRHIEANGVGYNQGYTTLEGFFTAPNALDGSWVSFLDVRGHVFNNGKLAANAGLGVRYLTDCRVWGLNAYYDYRNTHRSHYNQIGFGLETLGEMWDFRANGYLPVGDKESRAFHPRFREFEQNSIIISSKKEIAMKGANAEVGVHVLSRENYQLYAAAGPYYFEQKGRVAWGGEGRIACTLFDYARLQLSGSYDTIFHGIVQGEVALTFGFGGKKNRCCQSRCYDPCSDRYTVEERALQRVDRNEIVVVTRKKETSTAIDPSTGNPYKVWFVDNTSHSLGTFESPFNTLSAAESASGQNDIIYVFRGDGTDRGMSSGIILKHGQQLLGAGVSQDISTTLGTVTIPAQDSGLPVLSNANDPTTLGIQLVAGNNVVSGFYLNDALGSFNGTLYSAPVTILSGSNYLIQKNTLVTFNLGSCINVYGPGNQTDIINNTFIATTGFNVTDGVFFWDVPIGPITGYFNIANNLFKGIDDFSGFNNSIGTFGPGQPLGLASNVSVSIVSNTFVSQTNTAGASGAIIWTAANGSAYISGNYIDISDFINALGGVYVEQDFSTGFLSVSLDNNTSYSSPPAPGYNFVNNSGNPSALQINFSPTNIGTREGP